VKNNVVDPRLW